MPQMTILLSVVALLVGVAVGWVVASARKTVQSQRVLAEREAAMQSELRQAAREQQRALAERDLARSERERAEAGAELFRISQFRFGDHTSLRRFTGLLAEKLRARFGALPL